MSYYKKKLLERVNKILVVDLKDTSKFIRNYLTETQKSGGFSIWEYHINNFSMSSQWPIKDLVMAKGISITLSRFGDYVLDIKEK